MAKTPKKPKKFWVRASTASDWFGKGWRDCLAWRTPIKKSPKKKK